jgi:hypothetical protein
MRLVIDCGENIQPQVFEADTTAELIAKMMISIRHGTRKIREQQQRIKLLAGLASEKGKQNVPHAR